MLGLGYVRLSKHEREPLWFTKRPSQPAGIEPPPPQKKTYVKMRKKHM